jgi:hypothetical protein
MADLPKEATVLQFEPPYPVYRIEIQGPLEVVVTEPLEKGALVTKMRIAIPNPWAPPDGEERFLPGIAYGDGTQFLMDVGQAFGSLAFHEDLGCWVCRALLPKGDVMPGVVQELLEKAKGSFTQRLIKRTSKVAKPGE